MRSASRFERRFPTWAKRYTVGPHVYIRTRPGSSGSTGSTRPRQGVPDPQRHAPDRSRRRAALTGAPILVIASEAPRFRHRSPGGVVLRGLITVSGVDGAGLVLEGPPVYSAPMRRRIADPARRPARRRVRDAQPIGARATRPHGSCLGRPDDARSGAAGRRRELRAHRPVLRIADDRSTRRSSCGRRSPSRGASRTTGAGSCSASGPTCAFSDGTPLRAADVVRSWLRVIDPDRPSPLATLLLDVAGARDVPRRRGRRPTTSACAPTTTAHEVTVDLRAPGGRLPDDRRRPDVRRRPAGHRRPGRRCARATGSSRSGGYRLVSRGRHDDACSPPTRVYWAGPPAIATITLVTDLGGASPVDGFERGDARLRARSASDDAPWIAYDATLGPQLRAAPSLSTDYYGFDVDAAAVRRRPGPPGVRRRRRLAADRPARRARRPGGGRDLDGPARHPGAERPRHRCRPRPRRGPRAAGRRRLSRAATGSPRSRS